MNQPLELTYPEDLTKPKNFGIIIRHCVELVPDEGWRIIECRGGTLTLECDSIKITIKAYDSTENE